MTDTHMRILQLVAQRRRRELSAHNADGADQITSEPRRRRLQRAVTKSRAQVTQAEARRRGRSGGAPGA